AIAIDAFQVCGLALSGVVVAGDTQTVDKADIEFARKNGCGHQSAAGNTDDTAPGFSQPLMRECACIAVQFIPGEMVEVGGHGGTQAVVILRPVCARCVVPLPS